MSRKKLIILSPVLFCVVMAAVLLPLSSSSKDKRKPAADETVEMFCLNDSLTNRLSTFSSLDDMDDRIDMFLKQWEIKGASLAIMRNDSLLYAKGYGYADEEKGERNMCSWWKCFTNGCDHSYSGNLRGSRYSICFSANQGANQCLCTTDKSSCMCCY